jgi:preprotein translocase subunit Sec61beta
MCILYFRYLATFSCCFCSPIFNQIHSLFTLLLHSSIFYQAPQGGRKATASGRAGGTGGGRAAGGGSSNILQFYTDDSPGLQVSPVTVLVSSLSFVGVVVLLHIWGKFRM